MSVSIASYGLVANDDFSEVIDFEPRKVLPNRKHLKLMSRAVRLGVAAIGQAIEGFKHWEDVAPDRRGLFIGCSAQGTEPEVLRLPMERSIVDGRFSVAAFGELGLPLSLIHI